MQRRATRRRVGSRRALLVAGLAFAGCAAAAFAAGPGAGAASASGTTVSPTPTLRGTVLPSVSVSRSPTTAAPRTNPPATAASTPATAARTNPPATRAASTAPPATAARTTAAATTVPTTTTLPATTAPPATTAAAVATTAAPVTTATTAARSGGDSGASRRNSRIAWVLALMGVLIGGLTVWFWWSTRPVPVGMAGLAEMGTSRWHRADPDKRADILRRSRKGLAPVDDAALLVAGAVGGPAEAVAAAGEPDAPGIAAVPAEPVLGAAELPAWARDPEPVMAGPARPDPSGTWAQVVVDRDDVALLDDAPVTGPVPVVPAAPADGTERTGPSPWAPPAAEAMPLADVGDARPGGPDHG